MRSIDHPKEPTMSASHAHHHPLSAAPLPTRPALTRMAFFATLHCLLGCAVGEVLGMVIGRSLGWGDGPTIALAVALAFAFGYAFTIVPLRRRGMGWREAAKLALAADTISIAVMELVDNAVMLLVPGAMDAPVASGLFWGAMAFAFAVALLVAWPVNRWLIARGEGHALVHHHHGHHHHPAHTAQ
jgi:hypothetical protein